MPRYYTVEFFNSVYGIAVEDIWEFNPADDKPVEILQIYLSTDDILQDANEETMRLQIIRGHTTSGSLGGVRTPRPLDPVDPAAGFSAEFTNETLATGGTSVVLHTETWNMRTPWIYSPPHEARPSTTQGLLLILRPVAALSVAIGLTSTVYLKEY